MKILTVLCILACVQEAGEFVLGVLRITNYFISDYYRLIEVSMLCTVFWFSVKNVRMRWILVVLGVTFAALWTIDLLMFSDPRHMNSVMALIARAFLIIMSAVTLWSFTHEDGLLLTERPVFWLVAGVTLYSTGTIVILGLSNYLLGLGSTYFVAAWHVNWCLLIAANLFYTKGLLCRATV